MRSERNHKHKNTKIEEERKKKSAHLHADDAEVLAVFGNERIAREERVVGSGGDSELGAVADAVLEADLPRERERHVARELQTAFERYRTRADGEL